MLKSPVLRETPTLATLKSHAPSLTIYMQSAVRLGIFDEEGLNEQIQPLITLLDRITKQERETEPLTGIIQKTNDWTTDACEWEETGVHPPQSEEPVDTTPLETVWEEMSTYGSDLTPKFRKAIERGVIKPAELAWAWEALRAIIKDVEQKQEANEKQSAKAMAYKLREHLQTFKGDWLALQSALVVFEKKHFRKELIDFESGETPTSPEFLAKIDDTWVIVNLENHSVVNIRCTSLYIQPFVTRQTADGVTVWTYRISFH